MADLSGRPRVPRVGLGATRPPQTPGDPGAVKPHTCPCPGTQGYTAMSIQRSCPGASRPYAKQSAKKTVGAN